MPNRWFRRSAFAVAAFTLGLCVAPMGAVAVEVGEKAPDFLMHSTVRESVRLSDYQGEKNVLLFFFLAAFTSV